jgi:hypothetical protein
MIYFFVFFGRIHRSLPLIVSLILLRISSRGSMIFVYASFMKMPTEGSAASFSEGGRAFSRILPPVGFAGLTVVTAAASSGRMPVTVSRRLRQVLLP